MSDRPRLRIKTLVYGKRTMLMLCDGEGRALPCQEHSTIEQTAFSRKITVTFYIDDDLVRIDPICP